MKIYAISDLHISTNTDKPMDIFGGNWEGYIDKIFADWEQKVSEDDLVLIGGDISWAMCLEDAKQDLQLLSKLKAITIIGGTLLVGLEIYCRKTFLPFKMIVLNLTTI